MSNSIIRHDGRAPDQLRPVRITPGCQPFAEGSAMIEMGDTAVLCAASVEEDVPRWMRGRGSGWVTAEYDMLPRATSSRRRRDRDSGRTASRSQEIQRLIGRSLRAAADLPALGERAIYLDCDVLQADGGTRTAAITGAYVALRLAMQGLVDSGRLERVPLHCAVAAISVGNARRRVAAGSGLRGGLHRRHRFQHRDDRRRGSGGDTGDGRGYAVSEAAGRGGTGAGGAGDGAAIRGAAGGFVMTLSQPAAEHR